MAAWSHFASLSESLQKFQRALEIYETAFDEDHIKSAETTDAIGLSLLHLGKCKEPLQYLVES